MSFIQQLIIVVADKLVIGIAIVIVGYIFNKRLKAMENKQMLELKAVENRQMLEKEIRDLQAQKDLQVTAQIAAARLPAYKTLWEHQEMFSPMLLLDLTVQQRKEREDKLRAWYYIDGNGIFLSHEATKRYLAALAFLKEGADTKTINDAFSSLRTKMKEDMRIYNSEEAKAPTVTDAPNLNVSVAKNAT